MKIKKLLIKFLIVFLLVNIFTIPYLETIKVNAISSLSTNSYNPKKGSIGSATKTEIFSIGGKLWGTLRNISAIISVVVIALLGLKYMLGSVEEKSQYKETMIPIIVGCLLITSISTIINFIYSLAQQV